jgi:hypothetical protein
MAAERPVVSSLSSRPRQRGRTSCGELEAVVFQKMLYRRPTKRSRTSITCNGARSAGARATQAKSPQADPSPTKENQGKPRKTKENGLGFFWICLDSFVRFRAFQWVTGDLRKKGYRRFASGRRPTEAPEEGAATCNGSCAPVSSSHSPSAAIAVNQQLQTTIDFGRMQEQNRNTAGSPEVGFPLLLEAEYSRALRALTAGKNFSFLSSRTKPFLPSSVHACPSLARRRSTGVKLERIMNTSRWQENCAVVCAHFGGGSGS